MIAISLAVETLSGSFIPDELVKFVEVIPISPAFSFIMSEKLDSEPAIPSANATQASFPEAIIIVNLSSKDNLFFLSKSNVTIVVIILVIEAG